MNSPDESFGIARTPDQARRLRLALTTLASGSAGPALQDLACDVLSGKVELRAALQSRAYEDTMSARVRAFSTWYRGLTESQRDAEVERARQAMKNLPETLAGPAPQAREQRAEEPDSPDDDYFGRDSWLR
jgi:hypothetical protein